MAFGKRGATRAQSTKPAFEPPVFKDVRAGEAMVSAADAAAIERPSGQTRAIDGQGPVAPTPPQVGPGFRSDIDVETITSTAADLFLRLAGAYADHRGVHLETLIGAMAALAGEFALRAGLEANGYEFPNNDRYVIRRYADPYLIGADGDEDGVSIFSLLSAAAIDVGADPALLPVPLDCVAKATIAIGGGLPYPPKPSVPEANLPQEWSPNACARHRQLVLQVAESHGVVDPEEIALALGYAMANLFERGKEAFGDGRVGITPNDLLTLATEIMIYAARMVPLEAEVN